MALRIVSPRAGSWLLLSALAACASDGARPAASAGAIAAPVAPPVAAATAAPVADGAAAADTAQALIALAAKDNRVEQHLRHLCLAIGPRLTSSHNLSKALQWSLEEFQRFGLEANLERWGEFPVGFDRGPFRGGIVSPDRVDFDFTTMAWTPGTRGPTRGPAVIRPETRDQLAAVREKLPGAWLVTPYYARGEERPRVEKEERDEVAAAIAAAGIAGEVRGVGRDLVITDGNHRISWDKLPTLTSVRLRGDQHRAMVERIKAGEAIELEFDIDNRFYEGPVPQYNVIADIKGSVWPDEYVIVGGHLDSWDGAQGAVDNATGCATTLEAARLLMAVGAKPKRTIRFALWTGEEQGLFGSEGYVRDHASELERISAVFIHDGGTNYLSGLGITFDMEPQMRQVCAPLDGLNPEMPFRLRVSEGFRYSPDSDHAPFAAKGVPGFFWDQAGKSDYNHMHHTQHDNFETAIDEYQRHSALVAAVVAFNVANLDQLLDRSNFEALPPRRMGVNLEGTRVASITRGGKAEAAGWKVDDVVLAVDGVEVKTRESVTEQLQLGGPLKRVLLGRGEERVETSLDYTGDEGEERRAQRAAMREASASSGRKKFW